MPIDRRTFVASGLAAAALAIAPRASAETRVPPADRELRVPVQGGNLYVRVNGDLKAPRPPILFVHGGPGGALWQFFPALPLAKDRAIILYDQLDSGRSDAPGLAANWTVDRFVSEIAAVRAALGVEQMHLLGHSWGGIIANRYAATQPAGLRSVILQGAPLSARSAKASVDSLVAKLPADARSAIAAHAARTASDPAYDQAVSLFMRTHIFRTSMSDTAMSYMASLPEDRGEAVAAALTGNDLLTGFQGVLKDFDDTALTQRITAPTLLLCGELDLITPASARAMLPLLQHGEFTELAGAGHMAQFDQSEAWRAAVDEFVRRYDA